MTPETQARELLAAECTQGAGDYIRNGRRSFVSTDKAIRAIVAAGRAEREAVAKWLRNSEHKWAGDISMIALRRVATAIERGDHAPPAGEMEGAKL